MSLHVLVLAAGASTRLGQPKQLVKLGGRPALHIVVSNAVALAGNAVTVVVGAHAREMTHLLAHSPASVIVNRFWEEGMSSSLRFGVSSLPPGCDAVLVLLGIALDVAPIVVIAAGAVVGVLNIVHAKRRGYCPLPAEPRS